MNHVLQDRCRAILVVVSSSIILHSLTHRQTDREQTKKEFESWLHIFHLSLGTPCERIQCLNGGHCIQPSAPTAIAYCNCPSQYTGYRCEQPGKHCCCCCSFVFLYASWIWHTERMPFVVNEIMMSEPVMGPWEVNRSGCVLCMYVRRIICPFDDIISCSFSLSIKVTK